MPHQTEPRVSMQRCVTLRRVTACPCLQTPVLARRSVCNRATQQVQSHRKNQVEPKHSCKCCNVTESTLSLKRLANLECDLDDTMRPSCTVHSGCFVLLFPHHHSIVMTRALVVMIATHDSDLIVRGAVIFGTNKQPECIVRRIGLCHAITRAHLHVAVVMHICQGPRH